MFSIAPAAAVSSWLTPLWCRAPRVSRDCVSGPGIDLQRRRTRTCTRSLGEGTNTECLWVVQRRVYIGGSPCATATHAFLFTCFRLCIVYLPSSSVVLSSLSHSLSFPLSLSFLSYSSTLVTTPEVCRRGRRPAFVFVFNFSALYCYTHILLWYISPIVMSGVCARENRGEGLGQGGKSTARGRCPQWQDFRCRADIVFCLTLSRVYHSSEWRVQTWTM